MPLSCHRCRRWTSLCGSLALALLSLLVVVPLFDLQVASNGGTAWGAVQDGASGSPALSPKLDANRKLQLRHLGQLGALRWQQQGFRGQGIKVAILDSGFRGYKDFLGKALPETVTVRSFRKDGDLEARASQHGILCGEVIHTVAPAAELLLANWEPNDPQSFLDAIRWARQEGAGIISCSVIVPSWSDGAGGGEVNQAIARIVGDGSQPGDVLLFASAGNIAERHWYGRYCPDAHGLHQWTEGQTTNALTPWATDRVAVELYGPGAEECELHVCDAQTGAQVEETPLGDTPAVHGRTVRFQPQPQHRYRISLQSRTAKPTHGEPFHLVVLGGSLAYATPQGSIACPADGPGALAVGAVDSHGQRLSYSSCGPNSPLPKPDFVAAVPFPSAWREQPFSGTSAAAPQVAGVAAVVWSRHRDWTARAVRDVLRRSAVDLGPPGHDYDTGFGLIRLP